MSPSRILTSSDRGGSLRSASAVASGNAPPDPPRPLRLRRWVLLALAGALATAAACGGGTATTTTAATTSTTRPPAPTTTTTRAATTTSGSSDTVEAPAAIGEYNRIDRPEYEQIVTGIEAAFPFEQSAGGVYGRGELPEFLVVIGSAEALADVDQGEVLEKIAEGLSENATVDESSAVQETEGALTISCILATSESGDSPVCVLQEDTALGLVVSIPGVGPADVPTTLEFAKLVSVA